MTNKTRSDTPAPEFELRHEGDDWVYTVRAPLPDLDPERINPTGVGVLRCEGGELLILGDWLKR